MAQTIELLKFKKMGRLNIIQQSYRCRAHIHAVALACPGADYMRLWPLPTDQP